MRALFAALSLTLLTNTACVVAVEDTPNPPISRQRGVLSIFWTFDGFTGCGAVRDVRALVFESDGVLYDDAIFSCSFEGASYEDVLEGRWTVELDGLDSDGFAIYQSGRIAVDVIGNADNQYTVDLGAVN